MEFDTGLSTSIHRFRGVNGAMNKHQSIFAYLSKEVGNG